MSKFYKPINDPEEWKSLLADPGKHWKDGYSAKSLAYCWQGVTDFPKSVKKVFREHNGEPFHSVKLLLAFPEYEVALPPRGGRPSQNDIFILAKGNNQLISIAVEGKAYEPFGETIAEWMCAFTKGKQERLNFLCSHLKLDGEQIRQIRYQLLHRTVSAVILAERFNAKNALMLVHSFRYSEDSFKDYCDFLRLFGKKGKTDSITTAKTVNGIKLFLGWVNENQV